MTTRRNPSPRLAPILALMLCVACGFVSMALAQALASRPAYGPPRLLAIADDRFAWVVYPTPSNPSGQKDAPATWTVLRRKLAESPERYWTTYAMLSAGPIDMARYGERLVVLYGDGTWSIVGRDVEAAGPLPPNGRVIDLSVGEDQRIWLRIQDGADVQSVSSDGRTMTTTGAAARPTPLTPPRDGEDFVAELDGKPVRVPLRQFKAPPVAATAEQNQLLAWSLGPDGLPRFQRVSGDGTVSPTLEAAENAARVAPPLFERILYVIGAVTFLLVLFIGGRQTMQAGNDLTRVVLPPRPAPLARRLAAGIVDLVPLAAAIIYLASRGRMTSVGGMLSFDGPMSEAILGAAVLLYVLLLLSLELRFGASVGKMLFALKVVGLDGTPARTKAVIIRNLLRLVDLNLLTLVFVPLTPLRQRIGDFLAGTMVVDAADVRAVAPGPESGENLADK